MTTAQFAGRPVARAPAAAARRRSRPVWIAGLLRAYARGHLAYHRTGTTPYEASITLRRLFRATNGRFNDTLALIDRMHHRPRWRDAGPGMLGPMPRSRQEAAAAALRADGVLRFEGRPAAEICADLVDFARSVPCRLTPEPASGPLRAVFDPGRILATRYEVDPQTLHEQPLVQRLCLDETILSVAQAYLRCRPVFMGATMWWSTAWGDRACSEAAQLFHFDMPQAKFLKFFFYLTDVGPECGPHVFVTGSHRRLPPALLEDRRFADEEIAAHYPAHRRVTMTGPAGTVFAEDTRGLHKGSPLRRGHRLLLQLQFATSGFGAIGAPISVHERFEPEFAQAVRREPRVYGARFVLPDGPEGKHTAPGTRHTAEAPDVREGTSRRGMHPRSAKQMPSYPHLHELMRRFQVKDLAGTDRAGLLKMIDDMHGTAPLPGRARQHPMARRFHWGHRHDFGDFSVPGRMGNHHVAVIAAFIDAFGALPRRLDGRRVLDVGCWTGGSSLLLSAMGAQVVAVEEIDMYAKCAAALGDAFAVSGLEVRSRSLYDCTGDDLQDAFDFVLFAGVLHHLSDPRLALRIVFNCLADGGLCLLETLSFDHDRRIIERRAADDPGAPWGWNWLLFTPATLCAVLEEVGFSVAGPPRIIDGRTFVVARRDVHVEMPRAGLSAAGVR